MHGVFGVVSMFMFELSAVNVLLPLLPEQSFHLVVCESEEWLYMAFRKEKFRPGGKWSHVLVVNSSGANKKCKADGLPLAASPAHFIKVYRQTSTSSGPLPPSLRPVVKTKCSSRSSPRTLVGGGM